MSTAGINSGKFSLVLNALLTPAILESTIQLDLEHGNKRIRLVGHTNHSH